MRRKAAYFHRLEDAITVFDGLDTDWIDRRTIEEVLAVSKPVAWRIMRGCGAEDGPGNALICRKPVLVAGLRRLQETEGFQWERRRRDRLTAYLERLAEAGRTRRTPVVEAGRALDLVQTRFRKLPAGIELGPRRLTVDFASPEEFLERVGALIFALQNDYDSIREFIERGVPKLP
jgi:hypothetical protein